MLYTLFFYLALPLIVLRLLWRSVKAPAYRQRWSERFGFFSVSPRAKQSDVEQVLWLHTVSVGETIAAKPLVVALLASYPNHRLLMTTTTPTGSAQVQRLFADEISQGRIAHCYIPYDIPGAISRFLNSAQPQLAIFMETEVWPNVLHACQRRHIPTVLVNARLSERSLKGYQRFNWLTGPVFSKFSAVAAQDEAGAERLLHAGARPVSITGSLKSEITLEGELIRQAQEVKKQWSAQGQRRILIAASTHQGEDEIILDAYQSLLDANPDLRLILVPRHPERFPVVRQLCQKSFKVQCRSDNQAIVDDTQIILGDTMGEMMLFYGTADIAIVCGSFIDHGGHNMLEPAAWGLPIISGPSTFNFADIANTMQQKNALLITDDFRSSTLSSVIQHVLTNSQQSQSLGQAAYSYVESNRGALKKTLAVIDDLLK